MSLESRRNFQSTQSTLHYTILYLHFLHYTIPMTTYPSTTVDIYCNSMTQTSRHRKVWSWFLDIQAEGRREPWRALEGPGGAWKALEGPGGAWRALEDPGGA